MADTESPLSSLAKLFGVKGDGISFQTKRALVKEGVLQTPVEAAQEQPAAPSVQPIGGPSPSQELLDRVKAEQERRAAESFKRLMEKRRQQGY